jgi:hypothetical protein
MQRRCSAATLARAQSGFDSRRIRARNTVLSCARSVDVTDARKSATSRLVHFGENGNWLGRRDGVDRAKTVCRSAAGGEASLVTPYHTAAFALCRWNVVRLRQPRTAPTVSKLVPSRARLAGSGVGAGVEIGSPSAAPGVSRGGIVPLIHARFAGRDCQREVKNQTEIF